MFIEAPEPSEASARLFESFEKSEGFVMNLSKAWAWRPDVFEGFGARRGLLTSQSKLNKRDQAIMVCATAAELGDSYCSLAWGRRLSQEAGAAATAAVITGVSNETLSSRDLTLASWARKVVADPNGTTAADVKALRDAGFCDQEIFEATTFVAFRLAFSTINDALGLCPDWQLFDALSTEVRTAVNFGRPVATKPEAS